MLTNKEILDAFVDTKADGQGAYMIAVGRAIERAALGSKPSPKEPANQAVVDLVEAAFDVMDNAPCECGYLRRDFGQHLSSCYLFDLGCALEVYIPRSAIPPSLSEKLSEVLAERKREKWPDGDDPMFRECFEEAVRASNMPVERKGGLYRSTYTTIAFQLAFSTVNRIGKRLRGAA